MVLDRPYGFKQWVEQHSHKVTEKYILMSEPDHVFLLPPPMWATPTRCAARRRPAGVEAPCLTCV